MKSKHQFSQPGVALLMTLTVVLLLSVGLMKTFENRAVEVSHLRNNLDHFKALTTSRSLFRAVLFALKTQGPQKVRYGIDQLPPLPIPFGEAFFINLKVVPIDSRFLLNQTRRWENDPNRITVFANLITQIKKIQTKNPYYLFLDSDAVPVVSALIDWVDKDDSPDMIFGYGMEDYSQANPAVSIKNSELDRVSEIKAIKSFQELEIAEPFIEKYFRVVGDDEKIDINLLSEKEIVHFLERYESIADYAKVFDNREIIAKIAKQDILDISSMKYNQPLVNRNSLWEVELKNRGIELSQTEKNLFTHISRFFEVSYQINHNKTKILFKAIIELLYTGTDVNKIKIINSTHY
ncbi:MAG: general secretion pathway protein GspK [Deltaproteobacteria bacterium]|nr:general secretion pathway protein GspK [Deltaproteobacteria bacterium]